MSKKEDKLTKYKSPGVYTIEEDISTVVNLITRYCSDCYNIQYANSITKYKYCDYCEETTPVIDRDGMRELKLKKLL